MCSCDAVSSLDQIIPLPIQDPLRSGEGCIQYLQRLAELNVYGNLHWITERAGIPTQTRRSDFVFLGRHAEKLAQVTGCDAEELEGVSYEGALLSDKHSIMGFCGDLFPASAIDYKHPKVCPECLLEDPFLRQIWDLSLMTVCPEHGCQLVDVCPECAKPITWSRMSVSFCNCGGDYSLADNDVVDDATWSMARTLYNALNSTTEKLEVGSEFPSALADLDYWALSDLCAFLNAQARDEDSMISGPKLNRAPLGQRHAVVETAGRILSRWPSQWHELIRRKIRNSKDAHGSAGLLRTFGKLYEHLYARRNDGAFNFLRREFEACLRNEGLDMTLMRKGNARMIEEGRFHLSYLTAAEARAEIGCTKGHLEWLLSAGHIEEVSVEESGRQVHRILVDSVERYKQRQNNEVIRIQQVGELLGMSIPTVGKLLHSEVIPATRGYGSPGREPWLVLRADVLALRERINAQSKVIQETELDGMFSYRQAINKLGAAGVDLADVIAAISEGTLSPLKVSLDPLPLKDMSFDPENLDAFLHASRASDGHSHSR